MEPKKILIVKLVLMIVAWVCIGGFLILKIIFKKFIQQYDPQQYTLCSIYIKEKYSNTKAISLIQDVQLIWALILSIVMIGKCLYIILKEKPEKIIDIAGTKWLETEIIMSKVIMIFLICFTASLLNTLRQHQQCLAINTDNIIILVAINISALLFQLVLTAINFYLIYKNHSHLERLEQQNSNPQDIQQFQSQFQGSLDESEIQQQLQKMEQGNIFDTDSKNIRQTLLNEHKMPHQQDTVHQNQKQTLQQKLKKLRLKKALLKRKGPNISNPNNENLEKISSEKFIPGPGDELDPAYDRQKVNQINKTAIDKLQSKGYTIEQRPYIERIILTKKYSIQDTQPNNKPVGERSAQTPSNSAAIPPQVQQQTLEVVINLDTRQQKAPDQCYTGDDLQPIELDQIFYRQYVQKEKRQKEQLRLKILKQKRQLQLEKQLQNSERMKCPYNHYLQEDREIDKIYEQAKLYVSKKKQVEKLSLVQQQMVLYLRAKTKMEIEGKILHEEIKQVLEFQDESNLTDNYFKMRGKQKTIQKNSTPTKFKDRRNYIQLIRGKWAYL